MAARGEIRTHPAGTVMRRGGDVIDEMWVVLTGRLAFTLPKGGSARTITEAGPGYVLGATPYSRMKTAPGTVVVRDETTVFAIHRDHLPSLIHDCPALTAAFVHQMLDRARDYQTARLHDDRTESLGKLAAGLAHELNNPASAAARNASALATLLDEMASASRALAGARLSDAQLECVDTVLSACSAAGQSRSPLEAADREDDMADWLAAHQLDAVLAEPLAKSDVPVGALDPLASAIPPETLGVAVRWIATRISAREVARQIASATGRIHDLVATLKGFTFMDREAVPEEVDVAKGIADTIAMLEGRSRAASVDVRFETADDLPRVHGYGSQINQVWAKVIENAIDAAGGGGSVTITATHRGDAIVVRVADTGPGIPAEIQPRIFDPFFTTKPMGEGTGLGLDVARRLVRLHHGDLDFTSQPGRTVFRVRLPLHGVTG